MFGEVTVGDKMVELLNPVAGDHCTAEGFEGLQVGFITPVVLQFKLKSGPAFTLAGNRVITKGFELGEVHAPLLPIIVKLVFADGVITIEEVVAPLLHV